MNLKKIEFDNGRGQKLSAKIELPENIDPHNFAVFAHCFTCSKNLAAVGNISRALAKSGFGVMRFDFTGLGESEGEFEDTTFSSNIKDLVAAAGYMEENYSAPSLMVGHSLGGAAAIYAGEEIKSIRAIATVGAPSNPKHVEKLIQESREEIEKKGYAEVSIGGRPFTITKQFLEDLTSKSMPEVLQKMRKALLISHSPQDDIVGINNAADIFKAAYHPKSFLSLDGADHLLTNRDDSLYLGNVIAQWADRYVNK